MMGFDDYWTGPLLLAILFILPILPTIFMVWYYTRGPGSR
jgi:hypothetical protein